MSYKHDAIEEIVFDMRESLNTAIKLNADKEWASGYNNDHKQCRYRNQVIIELAPKAIDFLLDMKLPSS